MISKRLKLKMKTEIFRRRYHACYNYFNGLCDDGSRETRPPTVLLGDLRNYGMA